MGEGIIQRGSSSTFFPCYLSIHLNYKHKLNFRMCKQPDSVEDNGESTSGHSKCISQSIKASLSKQPHGISLRSPVSDKPRNSSDGVDGSQVIHYSLSNGGSQRITEPVPGKKQSKKLDSFREGERVIKIEES